MVCLWPHNAVEGHKQCAALHPRCGSCTATAASVPRTAASVPRTAASVPRTAASIPSSAAAVAAFSPGPFRHYLRVKTPEYWRALTRMILSGHSLAIERQRWKERGKKIVPRE
jgi:hypothetical protein